MKKVFIFMILISVPTCAFCEMDKYAQIQMLRAQIEKLQKLRDEKYSALQQCAKSTKSFKIAAAATISAAAIGIAVNVALKKKLDALDKTKSKSAGGLVDDKRSEKQKCLDEKAMYCSVGAAGYDAEICQLYEQEGCE